MKLSGGGKDVVSLFNAYKDNEQQKAKAAE